MMITNTLMIIAIGVIVYLLLGFSFLSGPNYLSRMKASIFNECKKNIYLTSIEEKLAKQVITRDEYEWIKSDRISTPVR